MKNKKKIGAEYICRVWKNNSNGQKLITIPAQVPINAGEFVKITKIDINQEIKKEVLK